MARAGEFFDHPSGEYRTFRPAPLPPEPPVDLNEPLLLRLFAEANLAIGRLDSVCSLLPDPDLFVGMYVRHEAVLSSQIEGTQSTLDDILNYESGAKELAEADAAEVVNYVDAMNVGLESLHRGENLSLRLIRDMHFALLDGTRGGDKKPGQFRTDQNWIGPEGATIRQATFVPPQPGELDLHLGELETFITKNDDLPALIHCGLAHAQFETIHPFNDGNGRVGRLIIALLLCQHGVLARPLLYLSYYFKLHRREYYDRLTATRTDGDWESWLRFFLTAVSETSRSAFETARRIISLRESNRSKIVDSKIGNVSTALALHGHLFQRPTVTTASVEKMLGCSNNTASSAIRSLEKLGILSEITGRKSRRVYKYEPYVKLFEVDMIADLETNEGPQIRTRMT